MRSYPSHIQWSSSLGVFVLVFPIATRFISTSSHHASLISHMSSAANKWASTNRISSRFFLFPKFPQSLSRRACPLQHRSDQSWAAEISNRPRYFQGTEVNLAGTHQDAWLVVKDFLDLLGDVGGELGEDVECLEVVRDLLRLGGAELLSVGFVDLSRWRLIETRGAR